ncbi:MAG: hypothetical protein R3204_14985 [Oceanospirillum sp.]|nr:hypothetical protein [Oceanospirillum sp.]
MDLNKLESLLSAFETDVRFPDTSGMEHFDMLLSRTKLENNRQLLTKEQKERLAAADEQMARQLDSFYAAISQVGDLTDWREKINPPATHWWWYLDVLSHARPSLQAVIGQQPATV